MATKKGLDAIDFKMTSLHTSRIIAKLQTSPEDNPNAEMFIIMEDLGNRLQDECSLRHFLASF